MAHPVTSPAMQRIRRLLNDRIRPSELVGSTPFVVEATAESFEILPFPDATTRRLEPFDIGSPWGRPWHTRWFRLTASVPETLDGRELVASVDLGFDGRYDGFQAEGLMWMDGRILQAVQPDRRIVRLGPGVAGRTVELWVEAAANPVIAGHASGFGPTLLGDPTTAGDRPLYQLRRAHLAAIDDDVHRLVLMLQMAIDLVLDLPDDSPMRARLFDAFERVVDVIDDPVAGTARAVGVLGRVFDRGKSPAEHRIVATGHAHLDTAWLWPIRETRRKAVRTFANAVRLLDSNPDVVYCHSQAQHYAWVAQDAPGLFDEVRRLVAEGRWEVVGGMWVEADLNLPSGESLIRQMTHGQRAFRDWFGVTCDGAFLPDDFGYPGGLPQIVAHCGAEWFFTQKLSWNETNRFPHHSFWWEGIDGTRLFTHFSPINTYNAVLTPSQLRLASRNFLDHRGASVSLALFGHGDGGGGPTQDMIDRARLVNGLDGVPSVRFGRVDEFFAGARAEYGDAAPVWVGEMYLEKHRGTFSSQLGTKQGNRDCERLLHELELWSVARGLRPAGIDDLWRRVLTQQFHDIIPGSSIAWVHHDAEREHSEIASIVRGEIDALLGSSNDVGPYVVNPSPVRVGGVVEHEGELHWFEAEAFSVVPLEPTTGGAPGPVRVESGDDGSVTISNGRITAVIGADGGLTRLSGPHVGGRSVITDGRRSRLVLRRDTPAEYDAWDIDRDDADSPEIPLRPVGGPRIVGESPLRVEVEIDYVAPDERSGLRLRYTLDAGSPRLAVHLDADWNERERRLQFVVPTAVHSRSAVCGTQFGHVERPRHSNTTWDAAKFEVCAHRYVHVSEPGLGVAVLADGPRGYDVRGNEVKLTLLRSPSFPDPAADAGRQRVEWSLWLDDGTRSTLEEEAARMAHPSRVVGTDGTFSSAGVGVDSTGILVSAVKPADDDSGDLIVRLWESRGATTSGVLTVDGADVWDRCDGLESPRERLQSTGPSIELTLRPFEIVTLRTRR